MHNSNKAIFFTRCHIFVQLNTHKHHILKTRDNNYVPWVIN